MTASLSPAQVAAYHHDGALCPLTALSPAEMEATYQRMEAFKSAHPEQAGEAFTSFSHFLFPWMYDLVANERILDAVESLIGPDIICWQAGFFNKNARDPSFVSWHQDSTYWGLEPVDKIVTAWLAFTPSTVRSGCMRYVPGTHCAGQLTHHDTFDAHNLLSRGQALEAEVDSDSGVDLILEPGQFSLHHVRLVHGSGPNESELPRFGYAIRYVPTEVRQVGVKGYAALVRGRDEHGHFKLVPRPADEFSDARRGLRKAAVDITNRVLYAGAENANPTRHQEPGASR